MDFSGGERREPGTENKALPPLPRVWIGYVLGLATIVAEMVAIALHPVAVFVNGRLGRKVMKSVGMGIAFLVALAMHFLDSGFGLILLFMPLSYVTRCVAFALAQPAASASIPPGSAE